MQPPTRPRPATRSDAAERLYVLWLVSTLMLVVLIVVVTLLGSGHLRRQALVIEQQTRTIDQLAQRIGEAERAADAARRALRSNPATPAAPLDSTASPAIDDLQSRPASTTMPSEPGAASHPAAGVDPIPPALSESRPSRTDDDLRRALDQLLRPGELSPLELTDRPAAERFLDDVRGAGEQVRWSGATLARLAALARLLGRDGPAEWFAVRAASAGAFPGEYHEIAVRQLLDAGQPALAVIAARRLLESGVATPSNIGLLASALAQRGEVAGADEALARLSDDDVRGLHTRDRVRVAGALARVEKWDRLEAALATLSGPAVGPQREIALLRAVLAIHRDRLPEAIGILDFLLESAPEEYELLTWRAAALLEARQYDAARQALEHAERSPNRPEAWYWRGMIELRDGEPDLARPFLERAVAASQRFAPAWEALGTISLTLADQFAARGDDEAAGGRLDDAAAALARAVEANPRRASAHFLLAIAHAKSGRTEPCAASLQTAFLLDRGWTDTAKKTPVLSRLFSPEEIDALVDSNAPSSTASDAEVRRGSETDR